MFLLSFESEVSTPPTNIWEQFAHLGQCFSHKTARGTKSDNVIIIFHNSLIKSKSWSNNQQWYANIFHIEREGELFLRGEFNGTVWTHCDPFAPRNLRSSARKFLVEGVAPLAHRNGFLLSFVLKIITLTLHWYLIIILYTPD